MFVLNFAITNNIFAMLSIAFRIYSGNFKIHTPKRIVSVIKYLPLKRQFPRNVARRMIYVSSYQRLAVNGRHFKLNLTIYEDVLSNSNLLSKVHMKKLMSSQKFA
uniref:Uncharacterized protein n=1 Tax=Ascaris lumbricoides TaxID=6252 RepID=A0A0M3IX93_ASCLU